METVNVSGLKHNPSEALRKSHQGVVVVLHRDKPEALMVGIELAGVLDAKGVKPAQAAARGDKSPKNPWKRLCLF